MNLRRIVILFDGRRLHASKERTLNRVINVAPPWVQILFMERVLASVKATLQEEAGSVLLQEKESGVRPRRPYRPFNSIRTPQLDLLYLQEQDRQAAAFSKLYGSHRGAPNTNKSRWYSYLGQRRGGTRQM